MHLLNNPNITHVDSNVTPLSINVITRKNTFVIPKIQTKFIHAALIPAINKFNHPQRFSHRTMIEEFMENEGAIDDVNGDVRMRKPRFLCLHGFRTSGEILKTQLKKWPEQVLEKLDLVFPDAPFPSNGKSDVEGIFDPPYYEWFQFNKEFTEYENFDKCLEYIEDCMTKHAPIDGLLGFSQGAILSAALPGLQAKGMALTKVPKIKFLMVVSGAKLKSQTLAEKAYSSPIQCPSLHFLGETDFLKPYGIELLKSVVDPVVIHHPKGHTIPRLDEKGLEMMLKFLDRIQKIVSTQEDVAIMESK